MRVGYIGLGLMGQPIALNLINAGVDVSVYARREKTLTPLLEAGACAYPTPAELAAHCDVIFTNVSDTNDVVDVVLGPHGIIEGAAPGAIVIDMSTISPITSREIASTLKQKQIEMLDAPVSGGSQGAIDGTLSIMVGGPADILEQVTSLLEIIGDSIVHVGDHGAGQITKACNQLVVAQTLVAIGEAFTLAEAAGVEPAKIRQALLGGFAGSRILEVHGKRMLDDNYTPGFKAKLHHKDMTIVLDTATQLGVSLPSTTQAADYILRTVEDGDGDLDSAVLIRALEKRCTHKA